ncbi:MAG: Crp/Fnr family transcriptional regulator [Anaerolineae bacterium]|nr:Crp/Fnr family transcriptional regulator [Anaerolineae bacterium]
MGQRKRETPLREDYVEPAQCDLHYRLEILRRVPFFAELTAAQVSEINRHFRDKGYTEGETIYFAGDEAVRLYVVASGNVKLLRHTGAGQAVLLDMLAPGEFFGSLSVLGDSVYPDTAQAQTPACIPSITAEDFQVTLVRYPPVALAALNITAQRLKEAHEVIQQLSAYSVEQRVAAVLLKLADKLGEQQPNAVLIQMPLSRQDIAEMTGTTPETASRILSQFKHDKLIQTGRRWVSILEQEQLQQIADGD